MKRKVEDEEDTASVKMVFPTESGNKDTPRGRGRGKGAGAGSSSTKGDIECFYCKGPHMKKECFLWPESPKLQGTRISKQIFL